MAAARAHRQRLLSGLRGLAAWALARLLAGVCLAAAPAWAQPTAAEIRTAVGVVFAQAAGGEVRLLQAGGRLTVGDTVGTQKGAFALLVFGDGSRVAMRPETALTVRGFRYRPEDAQQDELALQMLQGWLRKVSGEVGKRNPRSFELRVGDATIGIRGTDFSVRICDAACLRERALGGEGVLPQSGRLGQVVAVTTPLRRQRNEVVDRAAGGAMLLLGDVLATDDEQAIVGLDDGSRIVLGPRSVVALRSVEDDLGRRAVRLDLMQGVLRVAAGPRPGARMYGLLVNAGSTVGLRPDAALDASCAAPASAQAFACEAASVLLRQGRADVLGDAGAQALEPGRLERLQVGQAAPAPAPLDTPAAQPTGTPPTDPLDIPVEGSRPPSVAEQPVPGAYLAVFDGLVSVSNALGEVVVGLSQGAFVPLLPTAPPRALPASPLYMERDLELDRSRLYPEMCVR